MPHYLLELYTPKAAWLALAAEDRRAYFDAVGAGLASLSSQGIEAITFGETDATYLHSGSQQFFAVWKFLDADALKVLVASIAASGWHGYFDTVNIAGVGVPMADHLAQLAAL